MPGASPRRRKLDGGAALARWFETHPVEEWPKVEAALMAVQDDSWAEKYRHLDEVTTRQGVVMLIEPGLVMVWRPIYEYPDWFRVIYVGDPDDYNV